jgi:hypothetical protein
MVSTVGFAIFTTSQGIAGLQTANEKARGGVSSRACGLARQVGRIGADQDETIAWSSRR